MSDKYEWEETKNDNKTAIGGIVTGILGLVGFGIKVFSSNKQANKDMQLAIKEDERNRLNSKLFKTASDKNRIRELQKDINNLKK